MFFVCSVSFIFFFFRYSRRGLSTDTVGVASSLSDSNSAVAKAQFEENRAMKEVLFLFLFFFFPLILLLMKVLLLLLLPTKLSKLFFVVVLVLLVLVVPFSAPPTKM